MKKRTVTLLLSLALSLSLFGCGGSGRDINQEEPQQEANAEVEQEETNEEDNIEYEEFEYFYVAEIYDSDKVIPCNLDNLDIEGIYCGDWELTNSIDLYSRREGGVTKVGYTKENIPINVFASDSSSEWIQLHFDEEQPNTYLIIKVEDFLANSDYDESKSNYAITEEQMAEKTVTEEGRIYHEVIDLFDEDKTYTIEEFYDLLKDAAEISGVEFSDDVAKNNTPAKWTINLADGNKLKETYESLVTYMISGPDGVHKMDLYFGLTEENPDTSGDFDIYVFLRYHQD